MVNKKVLLVILAMVLVFGLFIISCEEEDNSSWKTAVQLDGFGTYGTSFKDSNPSGIRITAYAGDNATHYYIWYSDTSTRSSGNFEVVQPNSNGNAVYWFTNLQPNKTYYFGVQAQNRSVIPNVVSEIIGPKTASFRRN